jgi:lipopolysaccharide biosynthesis glycosyltransferase
MIDSEDSTASMMSSAQPPAGVVHVVFCADRFFIQHGAVAAVSMLENSPGGQFCIHYVSCDRDRDAEMKLAATLKRYPNAALRFHQIDDAKIAGAFADRHVTKAAYLRFLAPDVLPTDIDRIVYLDCDLVVVDDIRELASTDLGGHAVGAVRDADWTRGAPDERLLALGLGPDHNYVLSGMLVIDLKLWRDRGLTERIFASVDRLGPALRYHDQDAFNVALGNEIQLIDKRWNLQALVFGRWLRRSLPSEYAGTAEARRRPGVIHYSTPDKPWKFRSRARKRALYFRYLDMTEWRGAQPPLETRAERLEYDLARALIRVGIDLYTVPFAYQRLCEKLGDAGLARLGGRTSAQN